MNYDSLCRASHWHFFIQLSTKRHILLKILLLLIGVILSSCHSNKTTGINNNTKNTHQVVIIPDYWQTLDVTLTKNDNQDLYQELKTWLGVPYKYGGNTKEGVDCSGLVVYIYKKIYHIKLERRSAKIFEKNCHEIKKAELKEGDLIFFNTSKKTPGITHVGIYLKENKFVHSSSTKGVIVDDVTSDYWTNHFYAAARVNR